jgi:membrane-associated phospholipid phosphatase
VVALTLYFSRHFEELKEFATTVMATFFFCYVIFTIFPVRGPFYYFGPIDPYAKGLLFPQVVHKLLLRAASVGTAFPSSHVAASVAIWLVCRRYLRRLSHAILVIAIGIFVGTVYGGFHYALDALAGVAVGIACGLLGPKLHAWIRTLPGMALPVAEAAVCFPRPRRLWQRVPALVKRVSVTRRVGDEID